MKNIVLFIAIFAILMFASCNDDSQNGSDVTGTDYSSNQDFGDIQAMDANLTGRLHGVSCTKDDQCKYGTCYNSPNITAGAFNICTKDCTDASLGACGDDNANGITYTVVRWGSMHPEESLTCMCVPKCNTVEECQAIDPRYNTCQNPGTGTFKVCIYQAK